jgi:hypothetical protein
VETISAGQTLLPDQRRAVEQDLAVSEARIRHLVDPVATGKASDAVFLELQKEEAHKKALAPQLENADRLARVLSLDAKRIERYLTEWATEITRVLGHRLP